MEKTTGSTKGSRKTSNGAFLRKVSQQIDRSALEDLTPTISRYVQRNWQTLAMVAGAIALVSVAGYFVAREYGYFEQRGRRS
jgi:hypothetical protein